MERQKVPACLGVSWPLPQKPLPAQRQWEVHRANPRVTLYRLCLEKSHRRLWSPALLKHAPPPTRLFSSFCFIQRFNYCIKEASFGLETCTLTKRQEMCGQQHLENVAWLCNEQQSNDLWGPGRTAELFNINLGQEFQSNLGPAQAKTVK